MFSSIQLSQERKVSNGGPLNRKVPVKINRWIFIEVFNLGHLVFSLHSFDIQRKIIIYFLSQGHFNATGLILALSSLILSFSKRVLALRWLWIINKCHTILPYAAVPTDLNIPKPSRFKVLYVDVSKIPGTISSAFKNCYYVPHI